MDLNHTGSGLPIKNEDRQAESSHEKTTNKTDENATENLVEQPAGGTAGIDVGEQKIVELSEEEMDERKNNLRDAFNDDEYSGSDV
jgi:hypothetical protein